MTSTARLPSVYIPHGGGPCFFIKPEDNPPGMPGDMWDKMAAHLRGISADLPTRPKAVLVITAHWQTERPTFGNAAQHELLYDYYNFPPYTYDLRYPAKGAPDVAARAAELLAGAGIASDFDDKRGIDHGVFIPFMLIYPNADIPIVPMSLQRGLNAADHIAIGKALEPLRDEGVLIVGSGMSFHNVREMISGASTGVASAAFDKWLVDTCSADPETRDTALGQWDIAPGARQSHPLGGEEHLIPLMTVAGAAGSDRGYQSYGDRVGGQMLSGISFGAGD